MPLLHAAWHRLLVHHWHSIVFVHGDSPGAERAAWPAGYRYIEYDGAEAMPSGQRAALRAQGAGLFLGGLAAGDRPYVVWHGAEAASCGALMLRSPQRSVLGLPSDAVLIGLCETAPAHRRRGLFAAALQEGSQSLHRRGFPQVFTEVVESNAASLAAMHKAGFRVWGRVDAQVWFGIGVRRGGHWHWVHRGALR